MAVKSPQARLGTILGSIMQWPVTTLTVSAAISVGLVLIMLYNLRSSFPQSPSYAPRPVVVLTGLTSNTLKDFEGVGDFYGKLWNNRATYAMAHGTSLESHPNCARIRSSGCRHERFRGCEHATPSLGKDTSHRPGAQYVPNYRVGVVVGRRCHYNDAAY